MVTGDAIPSSPLELAQHAEILELESQIRSLNTKISAAVDHAADLQEIIRARQREDQQAAQASAQASESSLRRMSTYFSRRPSATTSTPQPNSSTQTQPASPTRSTGIASMNEPELRAALEKEVLARKNIEKQYRALQEESEVLSESLFEEANRMVAVEKRAVHELSTKLNVAHEREQERRNRLQELEQAMEKIQHVRAVLVQQQSLPATSAKAKQ